METQSSVLNPVIEKNVDPNLQDLAKKIVSTDQIPATLHYQGILPRGFANLIDQIIIGIPFYALFRFLLGNSYNQDHKFALALSSIILIIYFIITEYLYGQTIGKKLFKLRVVMVDGSKCNAKGAIIRNIGRILDVLLGSYLLGMVLIIFTPKKQRIGDLLAGTIVIRA